MVNLLLAGIAAVVIGFVLIFAALALNAKAAKVETKAAFVGFMGPVPFGFGTDKKTLLLTAVFGIIVFAVYAVVFWLKKPF